MKPYAPVVEWYCDAAGGPELHQLWIGSDKFTILKSTTRNLTHLDRCLVHLDIRDSGGRHRVEASLRSLVSNSSAFPHDACNGNAIIYKHIRGFEYEVLRLLINRLTVAH